MLINYCNEKLHQIFIELTLKSEQEEYLREGKGSPDTTQSCLVHGLTPGPAGSPDMLKSVSPIRKTIKIPSKGIEWINIDYFNNKPIVNLIEARPGILTLLDEECLRPGVTNDETLLDKFNTYLNKEQFYESREKNKKEK